MELPEFPNQFHPEMRLGLRLALMDFVVREIHKDLMNNLQEIIGEIIRNNKGMDRPSAFLLASQQIDKRTKPYLNFIRDFRNQMGATLNNAMDLEKAGSIDGAIVLYEKLANDAFTYPMPHDRLRILYTKQHKFQKAIDACERYIDILKSFHEFDTTLSNAHLISNYQKHISKLDGKLRK